MAERLAALDGETPRAFGAALGTNLEAGATLAAVLELQPQRAAFVGMGYDIQLVRQWPRRAAVRAPASAATGSAGGTGT